MATVHVQMGSLFGLSSEQPLALLRLILNRIALYILDDPLLILVTSSIILLDMIILVR